MDILHRRNELISKFTFLVGPLISLKDTTDVNEHRRILGKFLADRREFSSAFREFCNLVDPHGANHVIREFEQAMNPLSNRCFDIKFDVARIMDEHSKQVPLMLAMVQNISVSLDTTIFSAETPFACYNLIRNLSEFASERVTIFDRYLDRTVFHRYLFDLKASVVVTLITLPQSEMKSRRDVARYGELMDVSKLYAAERGPTGYRLMTLPGADFHDRWLRIDDNLFALGGSLKDLEQRFTVGKVDSTAANIAAVDSAMATAVEVFGPSNQSHP